MPPLEGEVAEHSEVGGVCPSPEMYEKTPLRLAKCRLRRLLACIAPAGAKVSPFGLPALPEGEPRALRASSCESLRLLCPVQKLVGHVLEGAVVKYIHQGIFIGLLDNHAAIRLV